jgi:hypothetical protein
MKQFECEDGFKVIGDNEQEVISMGAMHYFMMHPEMKISMKDVEKQVKTV